MRSSFIALSCIVFSAAAVAQTTVPNTFTAGTAAKAAQVNANFTALATAIDALASRVAKFEGQLATSDLVGTYAISGFQTELVPGDLPEVSSYRFQGTVTLANDGSGTFAGTELGHQLTLLFSAASDSTVTRRDTAETVPFTWSFAAGAVTFTVGENPLSGGVASGGRLLVLTGSNPSDGTTVILVLTRTG